MPRSCSTLFAAVFGMLVLACAAAAWPGAVTRPIVLGTFDSRSVAVAWANSEPFQTYVSGLHRELAQAQADGDAERVAELEAFGPELQRRLHLQGFSTAPVHDILAHVRDQLPALAEQAGVDAIVSRWELVWQRDGVEFVDVTDLLVAALAPNENGLRGAREIREHDPVPAEEFDQELDHED